jgi:hypothetical protein
MMMKTRNRKEQNLFNLKMLRIAINEGLACLREAQEAGVIQYSDVKHVEMVTVFCLL